MFLSVCFLLLPDVLLFRFSYLAALCQHMPMHAPAIPSISTHVCPLPWCVGGWVFLNGGHSFFHFEGRVITTTPTISRFLRQSDRTTALGFLRAEESGVGERRRGGIPTPTHHFAPFFLLGSTPSSNRPHYISSKPPLLQYHLADCLLAGIGLEPAWYPTPS